jgi:hypothetical protein
MGGVGECGRSCLTEALEAGVHTIGVTLVANAECGAWYQAKLYGSFTYLKWLCLPGLRRLSVGEFAPISDIPCDL